MRAFLQRIDRNGERYLMLVFYCFIVFVIVTEVLRRFVLDFSSLWGEEAARFAFIYLGWVGASYGVKQRAHIRFDILTRKLPARIAGGIFLFSEIATLVFACFALYWSLQTIGTMLRFDALSPALRISQAWFAGGRAARLRDDGRAHRPVGAARHRQHACGAPAVHRHAAVRLTRAGRGVPAHHGGHPRPAAHRRAAAAGGAVLGRVGLGTVVLLLETGALPLSLLGEALFQGVDSFALIAIPLFVLTGDVMVRSGLAYKLLDFAEATTGSLRTGFGTSTVLGCGFFACISGSDAADAAAIGRITMGRLVERGYPKPYACALVASGACTGILIPPSIAYIIIGLVLGISSTTLFVAAVVPGILVLVSVIVTNVVVNHWRGYENSRQSFSWRRWLGALNEAKFALLVPRHHPRRHLLRDLHADRVRRRRRGRGAGHRPRQAHHLAPGFPGHARDLGARQRRHPADHRRCGAFLAGAHGARRAAGPGARPHVDHRESRAAGPADARRSSSLPACSWRPRRTS